MPRNSNGVYTKPANTAAAPNTTITSSQFNTTVDDLVTDLNAARPVSAGGTGAQNVTDARAALDVAQKQSSVSDTTAGRGLLVGGFGVGSNAMPLTDSNLNNVTVQGYYAVTDTTYTNLPASVFGILHVLRRADDRVVQVFYSSPTGTLNANRTWQRVLHTAGTWTAWAEVYTQNSIVGTCAESGGVVTGSLLEKETSTNSQIHRLASGLQIAAGRLTLGYSSATICAGSETFSSAFGSANYFVTATVSGNPDTSAPGTVTFDAAPQTDEIMTPIIGSKTTTGFAVEVRQVDQGTAFQVGDFLFVNYTAIGAWY